MVEFIKEADRSILRFINEKMKCKILDIIMPLITFFGSLSFCMIFSIASILSPNDNIKNMGILVSLSIVTSGGITQILKRVKTRIRPYIAIPTLNARKIGVDEYSFPSGHTTAAFSIGVSVTLAFSQLWFFAIIIASLVGFSRIYLGVHYPTDVIAGVVVGVGVTLLINFIL